MFIAVAIRFVMSLLPSDFLGIIFPSWALGFFTYPYASPLTTFLLLMHHFYCAGMRSRVFMLIFLMVMIYNRVTAIISEALTPVKCFSDVWYSHGMNFLDLFVGFTNCTQSMFSSENWYSSWNVKETISLTVSLLNMVCMIGVVVYIMYNMSEIRIHMSKKVNKTIDQQTENKEWCGKWEEVGQILKEFSDPIVWQFSPEQIQDPVEVGKYLQEKCNNSSKDRKIIEICWALAYVYRNLLDPEAQQTKAGQQKDNIAGATVPQTAVTSDSKYTPLDTTTPQGVDTSDSKPKLFTAAPVTRKKLKITQSPMKRDEDAEDGSSRKQGTDSATETITESIDLKDLQILRQNYVRQPNESLLAWMVRLWDTAGDDIKVDGTEVRHLGSLSRDPAIDQEIISDPASTSLWTRILRAVNARYISAEDLHTQHVPWNTIEQGIQRLRELGVVEIMYSDHPGWRSPDEVRVDAVMWKRFVRLGPPEFASALVLLKHEGSGRETVKDVSMRLRAYADLVHGPTHVRIAAVETRIQKIEDTIEKNHKEMREGIEKNNEELKKEIKSLQVSEVRIRSPVT